MTFLNPHRTSSVLTLGLNMLGSRRDPFSDESHGLCTMKVLSVAFVFTVLLGCRGRLPDAVI